MKIVKWKQKLWTSGTTNREVSNKTGIPESYLSMAVNGKFVLNEVQKAAVARALDSSVSEIFD